MGWECETVEKCAKSSKNTRVFEANINKKINIKKLTTNNICNCADKTAAHQQRRNFWIKAKGKRIQQWCIQDKYGYNNIYEKIASRRKS